MATSGTTAFDLDIPEISEEAFERAGLECRSGYDFATARRSLNVLCLEWLNRGINLWTVEERSQAITAANGQYTLGTDVVDVIEAEIRTDAGDEDQTDYKLERVSVSTWAQQAKKLTTGRPTRLYVDRAKAAPVANLWPVPDSAQTYTMVYWCLTRIEDVGNDGTYTMDVPARFLPALISGLAYYVAVKRNVGLDRVAYLKADYEEQYRLASEEDRSRASWYMRPKVS
jgi:hypothetical protein